MGKLEHYKIEGDRLVRDREHCPECGPGTFMAHHANRKSCGRCRRRTAGTAAWQW